LPARSSRRHQVWASVWRTPIPDPHRRILVATMADRPGVPVTAGRRPAASRARAAPDPVAPGRTARVDQVVPRHGMGMTAGATSTEPRGATDPHRGDGVSRRGLSGADRFRGPAARG